MNYVLWLAIFLAGVGGGWTANGWRLGQEVASLKAQHEKAVGDSERVANGHLVALVRAHDERAERLAEIDQEKTAQLKKERHENKVLTDRIAAGDVGLRIAATCPATAPGGTEGAAGAGMGAGAGAVLDAAAGRAYSALREGIISTEAKLSACQRMLAEFSP